jgi:hypothetical protein
LLLNLPFECVAFSASGAILAYVPGTVRPCGTALLYIQRNCVNYFSTKKIWHFPTFAQVNALQKKFLRLLPAAPMIAAPTGENLVGGSMVFCAATPL